VVLFCLAFLCKNKEALALSALNQLAGVERAHCLNAAVAAAVAAFKAVDSSLFFFPLNF
jgi:hypothetical protein